MIKYTSFIYIYVSYVLYFKTLPLLYKQNKLYYIVDNLLQFRYTHLVLIIFINAVLNFMRVNTIKPTSLHNIFIIYV